jgi:hypothetical protein
MRKLFLVAAAAAAVSTLPYLASAKEFSSSGEYHGGSEIGPFGQCFNPPNCARHKDIYGNYERSPYAQECPVVRERIVTLSGHVIYRRRQTCH